MRLSRAGKSTLVYPFDELMTPSRVFHKPAAKSNFATPLRTLPNTF